MPTTTPSTTSSTSSSCPSVLVHDQPGSKPGSSSVDQPFTVVKPKGRRKPNHSKPQPLSQPLPDSHTLLFRPKGKAASLESADFPVLLTILSALEALLPARWIRGGGLAVDFATAAAMEAAASVSALAGVPVRASKPIQYACRTGVVSGVPPGLSPSAFIAEVAADNPSFRIHRAQRLGNPATSRTMKVVFIGSSLPSDLKFRFRSHQIRPFEATARKPLLPVPDARKLPFSAAPPPPRNPPKTAPETTKLSFSAALQKPAPQIIDMAVQTDDVPPPKSPDYSDASTQTADVVAPTPRKPRQSSKATNTPPQQEKKDPYHLPKLQPTVSLEALLGEAYKRGKLSLDWKTDEAFFMDLVATYSTTPPDVHTLTCYAGLTTTTSSKDRKNKEQNERPKNKGKR